MKKYKIIWSPPFKKDFDNILHYITFKLKEPNISKELYNKILHKLSTLQYFPEGYPSFVIKNKIYKKLFVNKYIIIYHISINTRSSFYSTYFSQ